MQVKPEQLPLNKGAPEGFKSRMLLGVTQVLLDFQHQVLKQTSQRECSGEEDKGGPCSQEPVMTPNSHEKGKSAR